MHRHPLPPPLRRVHGCVFHHWHRRLRRRRPAHPPLRHRLRGQPVHGGFTGPLLGQPARDIRTHAGDAHVRHEGRQVHLPEGLPLHGRVWTELGVQLSRLGGRPRIRGHDARGVGRQQLRLLLLTQRRSQEGFAEQQGPLLPRAPAHRQQLRVLHVFRQQLNHRHHGAGCGASE